MQKVTAHISERLGNNLFQIANCIAYGKRNGFKICLPDWKFKKYFNLKEGYFNNIFHNEKTNMVYNEPNFHFNTIPVANNESLILQGYYQSEKYFSDFKDEIKQQFKFSEIVENYIDMYYGKFLEEAEKNEDILISAHWRIGDYKFLQKYHPIMPVEYYIEAIKTVCENYPKTKRKILWFSDDIDYVIEMINTSELRQMADTWHLSHHFIFNNPDYCDMCLQSKTTANIIGNSTFSWWSAYLNNNRNKFVTTPSISKWFGSALQTHDTKDLFLPEWKQICV